MLKKIITNKQFLIFLSLLVLLCIIVALIFSLNNKEAVDDFISKNITNETEDLHTQTEESYNQWKKDVGTTYDEFTEDESKNGEIAANLAKEFYIKENKGIRDTSFFYTESYKGELYKVVGVDNMDGRDIRFGEFEVNIKTKDVKKIDYTLTH